MSLKKDLEDGEIEDISDDEKVVLTGGFMPVSSDHAYSFGSWRDSQKRHSYNKRRRSLNNNKSSNKENKDKSKSTKSADSLLKVMKPTEKLTKVTKTVDKSTKVTKPPSTKSEMKQNKAYEMDDYELLLARHQLIQQQIERSQEPNKEKTPGKNRLFGSNSNYVNESTPMKDEIIKSDDVILLSDSSQDNDLELELLRNTLLAQTKKKKEEKLEKEVSNDTEASSIRNATPDIITIHDDNSDSINNNVPNQKPDSDALNKPLDEPTTIENNYQTAAEIVPYISTTDPMFVALDDIVIQPGRLTKRDRRKLRRQTIMKKMNEMSSHPTPKKLNKATYNHNLTQVPLQSPTKKSRKKKRGKKKAQLLELVRKNKEALLKQCTSDNYSSVPMEIGNEDSDIELKEGEAPLPLIETPQILPPLPPSQDGLEGFEPTKDYIPEYMDNSNVLWMPGYVESLYNDPQANLQGNSSPRPPPAITPIDMTEDATDSPVEKESNSADVEVWALRAQALKSLACKRASKVKKLNMDKDKGKPKIESPQRTTADNTVATPPPPTSITPQPVTVVQTTLLYTNSRRKATPNLPSKTYPSVAKHPRLVIQLTSADFSDDDETPKKETTNSPKANKKDADSEEIQENNEVLLKELQTSVDDTLQRLKEHGTAINQNQVMYKRIKKDVARERELYADQCTVVNNLEQQLKQAKLEQHRLNASWKLLLSEMMTTRDRLKKRVDTRTVVEEKITSAKLLLSRTEELSENNGKEIKSMIKSLHNTSKIMSKDPTTNLPKTKKVDKKLISSPPNPSSNIPTTTLPSVKLDIKTSSPLNLSTKPSDKITTKSSEKITTKPSDKITTKPSDKITTKPSDKITTKPSEKTATGSNETNKVDIQLTKNSTAESKNGLISLENQISTSEKSSEPKQADESSSKTSLSQTLDTNSSKLNETEIVSETVQPENVAISNKEILNFKKKQIDESIKTQDIETTEKSIGNTLKSPSRISKLSVHNEERPTLPVISETEDIDFEKTKSPVKKIKESTIASKPITLNEPPESSNDLSVKSNLVVFPKENKSNVLKEKPKPLNIDGNKQSGNNKEGASLITELSHRVYSKKNARKTKESTDKLTLEELIKQTKVSFPIIKRLPNVTSMYQLKKLQNDLTGKNRQPSQIHTAESLVELLLNSCRRKLPEKPKKTLGDTSSERETTNDECHNLDRQLFTKYQTPLKHFKSYRLSPYFRTQSKLSLQSLTFTNTIDAGSILCQFDLLGTCNNATCEYCHLDTQVSHGQLVEDIASYEGQIFKASDTCAPEKKRLLLGLFTKKFIAQYGEKMSPDQQLLLLWNELKEIRKARQQKAYEGISFTSREWLGNKTTNGDLNIDHYSKDYLDPVYYLKSKTKSSTKDSERQEVRYFTGAYNSIEVLGREVAERPKDSHLWLSLAKLHLAGVGDKSTSKEKRKEQALSVLSRGLEVNRSCDQLWIEYLSLFSENAGGKELREICYQAVMYAASYQVWWKCLQLESTYLGKQEICTEMVKFVLESEDDNLVCSHYLLELILYVTRLLVARDNTDTALHYLASSLGKCDFDNPEEKLEVGDLTEMLTLADRALLWICYISVNVFGELPASLFVHTHSESTRLVNKEKFVLDWNLEKKFEESDIRQLFEEAIGSFGERTTDILKQTFVIYENLVAFELSVCQTQSAISLLRNVVRDCSDHVYAWLLLFSIHVKTSPVDVVVTLAEEALVQSQYDVEVVYFYAEWLYRNKIPILAVEKLSKCIRLYFELAENTEQDDIMLYRKLLQLPVPYTLSLPTYMPKASNNLILFYWMNYILLLKIKGESSQEVLEAYESAVHQYTTVRSTTKRLWLAYLDHAVETCSSEVELVQLLKRAMLCVGSTEKCKSTQVQWDDFTTHNKLLDLCLPQISTDSLHSVYKTSADITPDNIELIYRIGQHALREHNYSQARSICAIALEKYPKYLPLWILAIEIERKCDQVKEARWLLEEATKNLPFFAVLWKELCAFEIVNGDPTELDSTLESIIARCQSNGVRILDQHGCLILPT